MLKSLDGDPVINAREFIKMTEKEVIVKSTEKKEEEISTTNQNDLKIDKNPRPHKKIREKAEFQGPHERNQLSQLKVLNKRDVPLK